MDESSNLYVIEYGRQILRPMPEKARLIVKGDMVTNTARYLQVFVPWPAPPSRSGCSTVLNRHGEQDRNILAEDAMRAGIVQKMQCEPRSF